MAPFAVLFLLAACATPAERCLSDASAAYRAALTEQGRIAQDLGRGYTYRTKFERVTRWVTCRGPNGAPYPCRDSDMQPVTRKVPVDRAALQARLDGIVARLPALRQAAAADQAQCRALYPEDGATG